MAERQVADCFNTPIPRCFSNLDDAEWGCVYDTAPRRGSAYSNKLLVKMGGERRQVSHWWSPTSLRRGSFSCACLTRCSTEPTRSYDAPSDWYPKRLDPSCSTLTVAAQSSPRAPFSVRGGPLTVCTDFESQTHLWRYLSSGTVEQTWRCVSSSSQGPLDAASVFVCEQNWKRRTDLLECGPACSPRSMEPRCFFR